MYCSFTNEMLKVPFLLLQHRELPLKTASIHCSYKSLAATSTSLLVVSNTTDHNHITTSQLSSY